MSREAKLARSLASNFRPVQAAYSRLAVAVHHRGFPAICAAVSGLLTSTFALGAFALKVERDPYYRCVLRTKQGRLVPGGKRSKKN